MDKFPDGFLWGSATSSYQAEGGIDNSDWSKFFDAGLSCDHYHRFEEDFDLLRKLGMNAYRFSLEWSRIEPEQGKFNSEEIEHYKEVLLALRRKNIIPFVTLNHFTLPIWFTEKGGWLNSKSSGYFEKYTKEVVKRLGEYVTFWITINEPLVYAGNSYFSGKWPPQKKSFFSAARAIRNLIKAHKKSYYSIHKLSSSARVGIAKNNIFFEPYKNKVINKVIVKVVDYFWNRYFLNAIQKELDFLGLNYYFHNRIRFKFSSFKKWKNNNDNKKVTDTGWEIYPEGIYFVLKGLKEYRKPIYITENGLADAKDRFREDFIKDHLCNIHKAIREEVDVRGYFHWSFMDNLEWDKGYGKKFGLIEIDFDTLERKIRPSANYYAKTCKENGLICG